MPGVFRPYTLVDVLGTINQQSSAPTGATISGLGLFAETDEEFTITDAMTGAVQTNPVYDAGTWGTCAWA